MVFTTDSLELNSFWDAKAKRIESFDNKNYEVKRFEIVTPSQIDRKMYDFTFPISVPGPFCPQMWEEFANIGLSSYDIIVVTAYPYDHVIPAYLAAKRNKIPIIIIPYMHLEYPELYFTGLRLAILNDSDAVVSSTITEKNILLKYKIEEKKIRIIPPGLDLEFWNDEKKSERRSLGISENSIVILFAGTKSSVKGTINLIEALKDLWNSNIDIELVLIGQSMPDYEAYIKKLETKFLSHIHDLGMVPEDLKKNVFYDCDIFAMPSKSESFGIAYLEAWACSKPVIGCNIPAIAEVITDGVDGILVDFENKEQLIQAIKKLTQDQNLRQHLGNMGKNKVLQKYDSKLLCQTFESLCESLV